VHYGAKTGGLLVALAGVLTAASAPHAVGQMSIRQVAAGFSGPIGTVVGPGGMLFVVDSGHDRLVEVSPSGAKRIVASHFSVTPWTVALDGASVLVDLPGKDAIVSAEGESVTTVASGFSGSPYWVVLGPSHKLFVSEPFSNKVEEVALGGHDPTVLASGLNGPEGMAFGNSGDLFVSLQNNDEVVRVTPQGKVSTYAAGLDGPEGIAFNRSGDLFVAEAGNGDVAEVSPGGKVATVATGLTKPYGLAVDSSGDVFVTANGAAGALYELKP
jgi:glucose/arabinose dehydrogenase